MPSERFDLVVVGAGPAGSAAARTGAQLGLRTLLLERRALPRPKLCGGCVSLRALRHLKEPLPDTLVEARMTRVRLHTGRRERVYESAKSLGTFVDRARFDHWLARRASEAGVDLRIEHARRLELTRRGALIDTDRGSYDAGAVILATGADGPLTRAIRPPDPPSRSALGIEYIQPAHPARHSDMATGTAEFDFSAVPSGFSWRLHHGDHIYLGIGGLRTDIQVMLKSWKGKRTAWGLSNGEDRPKGHLIPCGGYRRPLGRERILLAGDAAGFVDAFTGEGIALALESGRIAAETVAHEAPDHSLTDRYTRHCVRAFGSDLAWSLRFKRLTLRLPVLLDLFVEDSVLFSAYLEVFSGRRDYSSFVRCAGKQLLRRLAGRSPGRR